MIGEKDMRRNKAFRRAQSQKAKIKAIRYLKERLNYSEEEITPEAVGKHASTHNRPCSCEMCGNPRKFFNEKTLSEKKAEIDLKEQMKSVRKKENFVLNPVKSNHKKVQFEAYMDKEIIEKMEKMVNITRTYKCSFHGRQAGALGIVTPWTIYIELYGIHHTEGEIKTACYSRGFEHIRNFRFERV
jgi:excinuclease UvrABC ATPase subunit